MARPQAAAHGKELFEPYPIEQVVNVRDPHAYQGRALCQRCHFQDGTLTAADQRALCGECHRFGHGNHPVDVVQKAPVEGLPIGAGGKVTCVTCHDPHQRAQVLRKPFNALCQSCHEPH